VRHSYPPGPRWVAVHSCSVRSATSRGSLPQHAQDKPRRRQPADERGVPGDVFLHRRKERDAGLRYPPGLAGLSSKTFVIRSKLIRSGGSLSFRAGNLNPDGNATVHRDNTTATRLPEVSWTDAVRGLECGSTSGSDSVPDLKDPPSPNRTIVRRVVT